MPAPWPAWRGGLIAPLFSVYPAVGFTLTIKAFAITILGGMGNLLGALVASLIIATVEALSVLVIPSEWQNAIAFGTMILVLLVGRAACSARSSRERPWISHRGDRAPGRGRTGGAAGPGPHPFVLISPSRR